MTTLALLQAAATINQAPSPLPSAMQLLGIVTAVLTLIMLVVGAIIYAYKLGVLKRDGEATRTDSVRASETLAGEVHNGFKTVHRRMDKFDDFVASTTEAERKRSGWEADIGGRVERVEGDVEQIRRTLPIHIHQRASDVQ